MMLSRTRVIAALVGIGLAPAAFFSLLQVESRMAQGRSQDEIYLSSPAMLKRLSLGYNGLLANIYWTRTVQYFGYHHHTDHRYPLLKRLLDITTQLDPQLIPPYEVGSIFLSQRPPEGIGDPDAAIALIQQGIRANPDYWRLYYHLGFTEYLDKKDYAAAAKAFEDGSRVPGAHPWMKVMAAMMETKAGDVETAQYLWQNVYNSTEDSDIKKNAAEHLVALKVERDLAFLQKVVDQYTSRTGHSPSGFQELVNAGMLRGIPLDPLNTPYKLENGKVRVQDSSKFPFLQKGLP